jgi:hypothetical protein
MQWTFYSATSFLEKCRKVVLEKWFFKLGFFFLLNHFSPTWKNVDLWYKTTFFWSLWPSDPAYYIEDCRIFIQPPSILVSLIELSITFTWKEDVHNIKYQYFTKKNEIKTVLGSHTLLNCFCISVSGLVLQFPCKISSRYLAWASLWA